jgi:hypothetical protein
MFPNNILCRVIHLHIDKILKYNYTYMQMSTVEHEKEENYKYKYILLMYESCGLQEFSAK